MREVVMEENHLKPAKNLFGYSYNALTVALIFLISDYAAVVLAGETAFSLRNWIMSSTRPMHLSWLNLHVICPLIYILFLQLHDLYTKDRQFWRVIQQIFHSSIYAITSIIILMYIARLSGSTSRLYVGLLWIFSFAFLVLFRYIVKRVLLHFRLLGEPVLLMGAGKTAEILLRHLRNEHMGFWFIGYLEDNRPNEYVASRLRHLGRFRDAQRVIRITGVQRVLVIAPGLSKESIQDIVYDLQPLVRKIAFIPDMGNMPLATMDLESLIDGHIVMFRMRNNLKNRWNRIAKFLFDWILTFFGTIAISPILLAIALWVYHDSPGPVIFKHRRVGRNGKEFDCYKFRSMCVDADVKLKELLERDPAAREEWNRDFKLKDDPRITKSGHFLRRTSLDELPQIFNVLKGEMSLVGPRPIIQEEVPRYGRFIQDYYMVRPGITGMWQTSGRSDVDYPERVAMDSWYVRNWNVWFDIVLLWRTFSVVFSKKGAY
jgi:Undecaprenyl-phosphate galactose phosphotransferase WbaP